MPRANRGISDRETFLSNHNITREQFDASGITWSVLDNVFDDYSSSLEDLRRKGRAIADTLQSVPSVHSVRMRVKDPESLTAKIIRKTSERPSLSVGVENYREQITDLVGVRALHLFKGDWTAIDDFIRRSWNLEEPATAYIKNGDSSVLIDRLRAADCDVKVHEAGYRSIHYLIETSLTKQKCLVEIQVRTVFEEGWSEIDHAVRYPQVSSDAKLQELLAIFSLFAGTANDLGSFVRDYGKEIQAREAKTRELEKELRLSISKLRIAKQEKERLSEQLDVLRESTLTVPRISLSSDLLHEDQSSGFLRIDPLPVDARGVRVLPSSEPGTLTIKTEILGDLVSPQPGAGSSLSVLGTKKCSRCGEDFVPSPLHSTAPADALCPRCSSGGRLLNQDMHGL